MRHNRPGRFYATCLHRFLVLFVRADRFVRAQVVDPSLSTFLKKEKSLPSWQSRKNFLANFTKANMAISLRDGGDPVLFSMIVFTGVFVERHYCCIAPAIAVCKLPSTPGPAPPPWPLSPARPAVICVAIIIFCARICSSSTSRSSMNSKVF